MWILKFVLIYMDIRFYGFLIFKYNYIPFKWKLKKKATNVFLKITCKVVNVFFPSFFASLFPWRITLTLLKKKLNTFIQIISN